MSYFLFDKTTGLSSGSLRHPPSNKQEEEFNVHVADESFNPEENVLENGVLRPIREDEKIVKNYDSHINFTARDIEFIEAIANRIINATRAPTEPIN